MWVYFKFGSWWVGWLLQAAGRQLASNEGECGRNVKSGIICCIYLLHILFDIIFAFVQWLGMCSRAGIKLWYKIDGPETSGQQPTGGPVLNCFIF